MHQVQIDLFNIWEGNLIWFREEFKRTSVAQVVKLTLFVSWPNFQESSTNVVLNGKEDLLKLGPSLFIVVKVLNNSAKRGVSKKNYTCGKRRQDPYLGTAGSGWPLFL